MTKADLILFDAGEALPVEEEDDDEAEDASGVIVVVVDLDVKTLLLELLLLSSSSNSPSAVGVPPMIQRVLTADGTSDSISNNVTPMYANRLLKFIILISHYLPTPILLHLVAFSNKPSF